ncbi:MAG TPA: hypothetical protein VLV78_19200 [Thermoanaerobaculia bacterium]|nr:hypothetical protein [Thermoanaerobaculia bacterium]
MTAVTTSFVVVSIACGARLLLWAGVAEVSRHVKELLIQFRAATGWTRSEATIPLLAHTEYWTSRLVFDQLRRHI